MTSEQQCYVYIVLPGETEFVTAGRFTLRRTRQGMSVGNFVYGRSYRERSNAVELDPIELRLQEGTFETATMQGFFGAIRDAMPDSWGRRVIERHVAGPLTEMDYLMLAPDDRAGALSFGFNATPPAPHRRFNNTLDLERLQQLADAIELDQPASLENDDAQVADLLLLGGTSMGGARPKAVVEDDNDLWIAKFARPDDRWNMPRVEHATMQLAAKCGLQVAQSRLTTVAGRDVLLVRRFDRDRGIDHGSHAGYRRARMVSALTLLRSDDDATTRRNWSYLMLADEVRRISANPSADLQELFARMCFNGAISNLDDHPRNHVAIAKDKPWRLSPAYDLTPSAAIATERRDLSMECGDHGRIANKGNFLSGCGRFLISAQQAEQIFQTTVEIVGSEWRATMRRAGVSEIDCERMGRAFLYEGLFD